MLEDLLFEMYKDNPTGCSNKFYDRMKKNHKLDDAVSLYRRIINYQVQKYGESLGGNYNEKSRLWQKKKN